MESREMNELKKVVNSHASDIQALTALVYGLLAQLHQTQGEEGIAAAEIRTQTIAKSLGSPFSVRPNNAMITKLIAAAKQPM